MTKYKVAGSNGFLIEFFQTYWDHYMARPLSNNHNLLSQQIGPLANQPSIYHVNSKKNGATDISDFRPINVLSIIPKIITKILATRQQPFIPLLIDHHQTAFTEGRQLMQMFLSTREILHHLSKNKVPSIFLKVDFKKAFDSLSWNFLLEVLIVRGFPPRCIAWVRNFLISSTSYLKVNGLKGTPFYYRRGLRQGDPYLYYSSF
jgi:Reverse transcriptase (RNA-dependent DNA polymerase)